MKARPTPSRTGTSKSRCAIYTRKSSEEGLDQDYNSLHAQRDACEAYVKSQAGEGWSCLPAAYDDGGISGGTMERPGLRHLLADVEAGLIDVVVVYKVDRLTRSLTDFAKIVDQFDAKGVSFVSVTQAFNTTTSMGRLTLNVLLSFAQFEREVTGERIRDKIAASKKKGMWMGGVPPLGYDRPTTGPSHTLVVNPEHADLVRRIYQRYLALGSVHVLQRELADSGVRSKITISSRTGKARGGAPLNRGALFHLLKNRTYLGEIVHGDASFPGLHPAIVEVAVFEKVGKLLALNTRRRHEPTAPRSNAPLKGLIFDANGAAMSPTVSAGHSGRRYRYYVSTSLQRGTDARDKNGIFRVPAPQIEAFIEEVAGRLFGSGRHSVTPAVRRIEVHPECVHLLFDRGDSRQNELASELRVGETLRDDGTDRVRIVVPRRLRFIGGKTWLTDPRTGAISSHGHADPAISKALKSAHTKLSELGAGPHSSPGRLRDAKGAGNPHLRLNSRLAFLAPDIQEAILDGRIPRHWNILALTTGELPLAWADQREFLGFSTGSS